MSLSLPANSTAAFFQIRRTRKTNDEGLRGHNEITDEARRRAARSGEEIGDILESMLENAKANRDKERVAKITRAQKYLGYRNRGKRRKKR